MEGSKQRVSVDQYDVIWDGPTNYKFTIRASGEVNTGGWTDPEIRLSADSLESDTLKFELVAQPPPSGSVVTQAFVPMEASRTFQVKVV